MQLPRKSQSCIGIVEIRRTANGKRMAAITRSCAPIYDQTHSLHCNELACLNFGVEFCAMNARESIYKFAFLASAAELTAGAGSGTPPLKAVSTQINAAGRSEVLRERTS
jgi:hypothetical protein